MDFYGAGIVKGFAWIREHWGSALGFALGVVFTSITDKVIESNDLEWLKAIWRGAWGFVVGVYDWFFSSAPIPVWLLVPVVALALIPVWQLAKRIRIAAITVEEPTLTEDQLKVLESSQYLEEEREGYALPQNIAAHSGLDQLVVEGAIDVLSHMGHIVHVRFGSCTLTSKGRAYLIAFKYGASPQQRATGLRGTDQLVSHDQ